MSTAPLKPAVLLDAVGLSLAHEPVPADQIVAGAPATGYAALDDGEGREIGVWEMTVGAMSDTEVDEVFVVLTGSATIEFVSPAQPPIELRPGSVVRLDDGMQTVWTVRETLRKIFIAR
ncbi:cupin domain-containing protein [Microbacter sp. GSS18]|nr:cupin domain-containing protein [Microbacter sp. GSS18]